MICGCFRKSKSSITTKELEEALQRKTSKGIEKQISTWMKEYSKAIKLLLLGAGESGKTTILKQMKILHVQGFTIDERKKETKLIRTNLLEAIKEIVDSLNAWIPDFKFSEQQTYEAFEFIEQLKITNIDRDMDFVFGSKYFQSIRTTWLDPNVQNNYANLNGYSILDSAKYFLDKIDQISQQSYIATDDDILRSRRRTTDIQKLEFQMKIPSKYGGGSQLFWVFDVGGQKGERRKWIQVFEGISAILFLVSASEFDMKTRERHKVKRRTSRSSFRSLNEHKQLQLNRMDDSLALFRDICESRFLEYCGMICFLNKQDQLRDKIVNKGYKMSDYFPNYDQYDYEPKVSILADSSSNQECVNNNYKSGSKYSLPIKTILKVGKISRQSSINSFNNLEPIRIPENNEDTESLSNINKNTSFDYTDYQDNNSNLGLKLENKSYLNSFRSITTESFDHSADQSLELEYRKARCYIKNLFVKVAEESFAKKTRKSSNSASTKKPRERECFFHYTVATDTNNIKKVFNDSLNAYQSNHQ